MRLVENQFDLLLKRAPFANVPVEKCAVLLASRVVLVLLGRFYTARRHVLRYEVPDTRSVAKQASSIIGSTTSSHGLLSGPQQQHITPAVCYPVIIDDILSYRIFSFHFSSM